EVGGGTRPVTCRRCRHLAQCGCSGTNQDQRVDVTPRLGQPRRRCVRGVSAEAVTDEDGLLRPSLVKLAYERWHEIVERDRWPAEIRAEAPRIPDEPGAATQSPQQRPKLATEGSGSRKDREVLSLWSGRSFAFLHNNSYRMESGDQVGTRRCSTGRSELQA